MNREDILRLAHEAGIYHAYDSESQWDGLADEQLIERHPDPIYSENRIVAILGPFAELVAAAEQERAWVGLTDEEIGVPLEAIQPHEAILFARVIEALLKEKNQNVN